MNLIHGFYSKNTNINPDCMMLQRQCYATVLREMFISSWSKSTVNTLYELKSSAETSTGSKWDTVSGYFDALGALAKDGLDSKEPKFQFITYFCDVVYLIEKNKLDGNKRINDLILSDKEYNSAELHDKQIHNAMNMLKAYSAAF